MHRDVKPANIFISDRDVVKLLDFGLAKQASVVDFDANASSGFTAAGRVFGTANYMSPERLLGHALDHRSDLFSLGAVVYQMATASQAFRATSAIETIDAILHDQPRWDRPIPPALKRLIKKLLEKNPDNRYQSAKAVMNALLEARAQVTEGKAASASTPPTSLVRASIAVLSFRNLANDPEIEYFCDGLAEELITAFTKVEGVRVAARTSTFTFKGKDVDIRDVGERLKVNAVVDGSVRKTGNGIRVSCQLLNTEDGYELWSEQYDRELADVLMLQEDITRAIVDKLKVSLVEHLRPNRLSDREQICLPSLPEGALLLEQALRRWIAHRQGGVRARDCRRSGIRARVLRARGHARVPRALLAGTPTRRLRSGGKARRKGAFHRIAPGRGAHVAGPHPVERILGLGGGRE